MPQNEPEVIATRGDLLGLVERLRDQRSEPGDQNREDTTPSFAYDSEFIGEETYYPRLCVIQVATTETVTLIDALAIEHNDLMPFWELLADPVVEKVVHAGQQDLEPVVRHLNRAPANIFDVQVAAGFVGAPYPSSLSRLIAELIDPKVAGGTSGGGAKFSQWDQRPLTPVQLHYAANDVRYLPLLRNLMIERLNASGNAERAHREFEELCDPALYRFDASSPRLRGFRPRGRGVERLEPAQKAALRALFVWREHEARARDLPPRTFVADGVLFEIARSLITDPYELRRVRGLPKPVKRHQSQELIQLVRDALDASAGEADRELRPPPGARGVDFERERAAVDALWHAMRERAHEHGIDPAIITSKRELTALIRSRHAHQPDRASGLRIARPGGWRFELLRDLLTEKDQA